ncbi:transcription factor IIa-like protein [Trypanosoma conorhini]|uniref:Transcription factor IIa-like protein n=1 Tax=Trypanosoma conorhini TaxID=83891 RepID=A0A3R7NDY3_9TRYP|nr:transcription factor IIa-like protein [Trypanosoma conorhini]RNF17183.1 transcription factor IIa-like protein [Trypanosoma conorhini]
MYRESLLGVALAATLAELESVCCLSEGQKEELWDIFDVAMDRTLAESPVTSQLRVFAPAPSVHKKKKTSVDGGGDGAAAELSTRPTKMMFPCVSLPPSSPATSLSCCDVLDDGVAYPVYRVKDDIWTIILKAPTLEVKDGAGNCETIYLDYLKVHLKDVQGKAGPKNTVAGKKRKR